MNTVIVQGDEIRLSSGLNEYSFGKTNYFTLLSEKGLIFEDEKFEKWSFSGINTFKDNIKTEKTNDDPDSEDIVFYCGKNPLSEKAKSLLDFFKTGGDSLLDAVVIVINTMTYAAKNNIELPAVGAGGIIIDIENKKVLFLPESIFKYSTKLLPDEEYFYENSGWTNSTIKGIPAICYERALIVYKFLTKRFPYNAINETDRNEDILDKNFLPLELCIEGINQDFAKEINRALKLNSTSVSIPGKKKKGVDSEDLTVHLDFDIEMLKEAWNFSKSLSISENKLAEKASSYIKNQKKKIEARRKIRRNTTAIIISACAAVFLIALIFSTAKRQNNQFTSKGLTSYEVIQGFFKGINAKDMKTMNPLVSGPVPEKFIDNVMQIYLIEKQISSFTREQIFANPENWFLNVTNDDRFRKIRVFGISNLKIDGMPSELNVELYTRSQHPEPITYENGKELSQNDVITHNVEYYLLQTKPEDFSLIVQKVTELHTLNYRNGKWLITDIASKQEDIPVNTEKFEEDYFMALAKHNNNPIEVLDSLREKYPWLPSNFAVEQEYLKMMEQE